MMRSSSRFGLGQKLAERRDADRTSQRNQRIGQREQVSTLDDGLHGCLRIGGMV